MRYLIEWFIILCVTYDYFAPQVAAVAAVVVARFVRSVVAPIEQFGENDLFVVEAFLSYGCGK